MGGTDVWLKDTMPTNPNDLCISVPISHLLTVGLHLFSVLIVSLM